ncbi:NAD(P)H-dependent oxidoreductase [bacterium]|nr:NAD(P)H-dependent oxidoreductase [bacterium]
MANHPKILVISGSLRRESFNTRLAQIGARGAEAAGAEVTDVNLRDYPLPLFDEDLEAEKGMLPEAKALKTLIAQHDGLLIASPEYNSSITAVLKNAIDWTSRKETADEPMVSAYAGKTAALMSASPSALGGLRGMFHLRDILQNIRVTVLADYVTVSSAHQQFEGEDLKDAQLRDRAEGIGRRLAEHLASLK